MKFTRLPGIGLTLAVALVLFDNTAAAQGAKRTITKIAATFIGFRTTSISRSSW